MKTPRYERGGKREKAVFGRLLVLQRSFSIASFKSNARPGQWPRSRDFGLATMDLKNMRGQPVAVDGVFMKKDSLEPGLEVADLIAHTAGRQRRHELRGKDGHLKDFQQTYWFSPIPPEFLTISSMEIAAAVEAGKEVPSRKE